MRGLRITLIATIGYLATGHLDLRQVSTAAFAPVLFIAGLLWFRPRAAGQTGAAGPQQLPPPAPTAQH